MGAVEAAVEAVAGSGGRVAGRSGGMRAVPDRPLPVGPGRAVSSARRPVRARSQVARVRVAQVRAGQPRAVGLAGEAVRSSAARPVAIRPVPRVVQAAREVAPVSRWRGPLSAAAVLVAAALVVVALGLLADAVRTARVPDTVARVQVSAGESLWGVARRVAPSADPGAVAARIVELNGLGSRSVQPGEVLLSPIG